MASQSAAFDKTSATPPPTHNPLAGHPSRDEAKAALEDVIGETQEVLVSISGVPVLDLFPDTVTLDRTKITIVKRQFFRVADIMSIRIEDVLNISCTVGPFFASVTVVARVMGTEQITTVPKLWRADAKRFKRIGQGYIIARQQDIDCTNLPVDELRTLLEKLGADNHQT